MRFAGFNGPRDHHRQRYWCVPSNGDRPHRFTEPLPREESWHDACELCERDVEFPEGPHAARWYEFVARGIAEALVMVGAGSTYREAALVARERAKRLGTGPGGEPRHSRHGSLVMDWVEVFAPVVFEPYRPGAWPAGGSLLLDDLPFRVRDPATGRHRIAFRVFAAMGYEAGRPKLRDHVALFGIDVTNPQQSTDQSGSPDVIFGFTGKGGNEFQNVTAQIAHRGDVVSGFGT